MLHISDEPKILFLCYSERRNHSAQFESKFMILRQKLSKRILRVATSGLVSSHFRYDIFWESRSYYRKLYRWKGLHRDQFHTQFWTRRGQNGRNSTFCMFSSNFRKVFLFFFSWAVFVGSNRVSRLAYEMKEYCKGLRIRIWCKIAWFYI